MCYPAALVTGLTREGTTEQEEPSPLSHLVLVSSLAGLVRREGRHRGCWATGESFSEQVGLPNQADWRFYRLEAFERINGSSNRPSGFSLELIMEINSQNRAGRKRRYRCKWILKVHEIVNCP